MVGDQHINAEVVLNHLCTLDGMTREKARELLNPADKQNVPKAVRLIKSLTKLEAAPTIPGSEKERRALIFLGQFFDCFVAPFTVSTYSLSDQVERLVAHAHIAAVLYKRHQTGCMTGALYADSQAAVKSMVFTIARLQEVESNIRDDDLRDKSVLPILFFIGHEGTDRLEVLFGEARTHDHARNFDILQLCQKLASSVLVSSTFERNPDIDPGHKRLKLKDMEGIDHTNPFSWDGNIEVRNVDLVKSWAAGRDLAADILHHWDGTIVDFDEWFSKPGHDLLRPLGDKYVGVDYGVDSDDVRSEEDKEMIHPALAAPTADINMQDAQDSPSTAQDSDNSESTASDGDEDAPANSELDHSASAARNQISGPENWDEDDDHDDSQDDIDPGFDFDEWLPDGIRPLTDHDSFNFQSPESTDLPELPISEPVKALAPSLTHKPPSLISKILLRDGKKYFKSSVVASLCSKWSKKLSIRPLRVRGWSLENFVKTEVIDDCVLDHEGLVKRGRHCGSSMPDESANRTGGTANIWISRQKWALHIKHPY